MQSWQQCLVNERGGVDGQNYANLVQATHEAHEGMDLDKRGYSEVRTVRAIVLGGVLFESICQNVLVEQGNEPQPVAPSYEIPQANLLPPLPKPFESLATGYLAGLQARASQDSSRPSHRSTGFKFYEGAYGELLDPYWEERLASGDLGHSTREELEKLWEQSKNFNNVMLSAFGDNVSDSLDILIAFGASLSLAKQRPCQPEELSEYVTDNIDVATALISVTRQQRKNPKAALPFRYGCGVLLGETEMISQQYVEAIEDNDKDCGYQARWRHPSLRGGSWKRPGHCPASDYNRLQPRTDEEAIAIEASLGSVGLSRLFVDGSVTSGQLTVAKALGVARTTVYREDEWQKRFACNSWY